MRLLMALMLMQRIVKSNRMSPNQNRTSMVRASPSPAAMEVKVLQGNNFGERCTELPAFTEVDNLGLRGAEQKRCTRWDGADGTRSWLSPFRFRYQRGVWREPNSINKRRPGINST